MSSTVPTLASNRRVEQAGLVYVLSYALIFVMALAAFLWIAIARVNPSKDDVVADVFLGGIVVWLALTVILYLRYYLTFVHTALQVPSGVSGAELPRLIEAAKPLEDEEFASGARVRTLLGGSANCRIELYRNGIRIWRGRDRDGFSFSFLYTDMVQAEMSTLVVGRGPSAAYVRLVAARPRMAFLISPRRWSRELVMRLGDHGMATFGRV
jgi:hypothetical protein